jgi:hypothetical protein
MLVKVLVSVVVSIYVLFAGGFADVFKVFDTERCEVFDIYV